MIRDLFKSKPKPRLEDGYRDPKSELNAMTLMLISSIEHYPPMMLCSVLSATVRDREDIPPEYLRKLASELDRHADLLERTNGTA